MLIFPTKFHYHNSFIIVNSLDLRTNPKMNSFFVLIWGILRQSTLSMIPFLVRAERKVQYAAANFCLIFNPTMNFDVACYRKRLFF